MSFEYLAPSMDQALCEQDIGVSVCTTDEWIVVPRPRARHRLILSSEITSSFAPAPKLNHPPPTDARERV